MSTFSFPPPAPPWLVVRVDIPQIQPFSWFSEIFYFFSFGLVDCKLRLHGQNRQFRSRWISIFFCGSFGLDPLPSANPSTSLLGPWEHIIWLEGTSLSNLNEYGEGLYWKKSITHLNISGKRVVHPGKPDPRPIPTPTLFLLVEPSTFTPSFSLVAPINFTHHYQRKRLITTTTGPGRIGFGGRLSHSV